MEKNKKMNLIIQMESDVQLLNFSFKYFLINYFNYKDKFL